MDDLITFLRARYDEREARARAWERLEQPRGDHYPGECDSCDAARRRIANAVDHDDFDDPAFVLADVEAKRQLLQEHQDNGVGSCGTCVDWMNDHLKWPCTTVRLLALPYVDHPEFREEWKP